MCPDGHSCCLITKINYQQSELDSSEWYCGDEQTKDDRDFIDWLDNHNNEYAIPTPCMVGRYVSASLVGNSKLMDPVPDVETGAECPFKCKPGT